MHLRSSSIKDWRGDPNNGVADPPSEFLEKVVELSEVEEEVVGDDEDDEEDEDEDDEDDTAVLS